MHVGGMATGKSAGLLAAWAAFDGVLPRLAFTAGSDPVIRSRAGGCIPARHVESWVDLVDKLICESSQRGRVLAIVDEVQFFPAEEDRRRPLLAIHELVRQGSTIEAAGLLTSTEFEPFLATLDPLGYATVILPYRHASCGVCGGSTTHALCTEQKQGAILEGQGHYEPRCLWHLRDNRNIPQELRDHAIIAEYAVPDPTTD